jgi:COX assembly mitochondrial protein 1
MRDRAKVEKCFEEVSAFESCCKDSSLLMVVKCRKENDNLKNCLSTWYKNQDFIKECTEIYLNERSEFRRTGMQKKYRDYLKNRAKESNVNGDHFQ